MANKVFKTLDEQIDILKSKGLTINDIETTKNILFRENYFFISGYRHIFMIPGKKNVFFPGTTFEELYAMFIFDRNIRNIFFHYILIVENNVKSIMSYLLSKRYGFKEKEYLNPNNYVQDDLRARQVHDILNKVKRQIRINGSKHSATNHYLSYYGYIPLWVLVKVLSFGLISEFYCILKSEAQHDISNIYKVNPTTFSLYLSLMANYRNLCAHEDMVYDHIAQKSIPDTKYHMLLNIPTDVDGYIYGKNDLFSLIIMFKSLLSHEEFQDLINEIGYEIDVLDGKIEIIGINDILKQIGFPNNWRDISDME